MSLDPLILKSAELFADLDGVQLKAVLEAGTQRRLGKGGRAFAQGDPGRTCHHLLQGRMKIVQSRGDGDQVVMRFVGPGETYGTVAAFVGHPFPADAVAVVDSLEVYWPVETLRGLMTRFPDIAIRATASVCSRLLELQNRVGELSAERVEQRIARALDRLARQAGRSTPDGIEIDFPITRQELAEMAGSTLHTVSRTLSAWDARGITASSRRRIVVKRPQTLAGMAKASSR